MRERESAESVAAVAPALKRTRHCDGVRNRVVVLFFPFLEIAMVNQRFIKGAVCRWVSKYM